MPIATGLEREELEAELQVRWSSPSRGPRRGVVGVECASDLGLVNGVLIPRSGLGFAGEEAV